MNREIKVGFIIDPLCSLRPEKDTSIALMKEVASLGGRIFVAEVSNLVVRDQIVYAFMSEIQLSGDRGWYTKSGESEISLESLDHVWLRKDPPFDNNYLYATHILYLAIKNCAKVVNNPAAIRRFNEKLCILNFSCIPKSIVSSDLSIILDFLESEDKIVIKSLDSFGGRGVMFLQKNDLNKETIIKIMTKENSTPIMAQKYIPEIIDGDKRIIILNGKPFPKALARIPKPGDLRGNIDAGASVKSVDLTKNDLLICEEVAPMLIDSGIVFAGLDVIGDKCTEINVTSPTCIKEYQKLTGINIASKILSSIL